MDGLADGSLVLVDANILVYHAAGASEQIRRLLHRGERGKLQLRMSAASYAEALHRLMLAEARQAGLLTGSNPARRLKEHPEIVRGFGSYLVVENVIREAAMRIVPLTREIVTLSHGYRSRYGLLVNDSLLVATAVMHEIHAVATADRDLAVVVEIDTYPPDDVQEPGFRP